MLRDRSALKLTRKEAADYSQSTHFTTSEINKLAHLYQKSHQKPLPGQQPGFRTYVESVSTLSNRASPEEKAGFLFELMAQEGIVNRSSIRRLLVLGLQDVISSNQSIMRRDIPDHPCDPQVLDTVADLTMKEITDKDSITKNEFIDICKQHPHLTSIVCLDDQQLNLKIASPSFFSEQFFGCSPQL